MKPLELKKLIKEEVRSALNEEKKYVKDLIDKKKPLDEVADKRPTDLERERYTDKEMLTRTTANQFPANFTILDIIERYKEYVVGHLRSEGELNEVNELEADPTGVSVELFIPLRKSIVKVLDDAFMIAVKNDQSEEELDRSLKTITDIINNILLGTIRNKKKYYKFN